MEILEIIIIVNVVVRNTDEKSTLIIIVIFVKRKDISGKVCRYNTAKSQNFINHAEQVKHVDYITETIFTINNSDN